MKNLRLTTCMLLSCATLLLASGTARATTCYPDLDEDGYGDATSPGVSGPSCGPGFVDNNFDCDDANPDVNPGATEICNGVDDDCNLQIDDNAADRTLWYPDSDLDSYGANSGAVLACTPPNGYVAQSGDCDDATQTTYPGAPEICNGFDDDCDGQVDDNAVDATTWYPDGDLDGFGSNSSSIVACSPPNGYAAQSGDCDDADPTMWPGAPEVCDGRDNNCNGQTDEGCCLVSITGDLNVSGNITSADIIGAVNYCFKGGATPPPCAAVADVNCNGGVTSADIIYLVNYVFKGGTAPCDVCTLIPGTWFCP